MVTKIPADRQKYAFQKINFHDLENFKGIYSVNPTTDCRELDMTLTCT